MGNLKIILELIQRLLLNILIQYISQLASCSNSAVVGGGAANQSSQDQNDRDSQAKMHYYLALQGLKLLRLFFRAKDILLEVIKRKYFSNWTAIVMEVYSWKLVNPCDSHTNPNCPKDAEDYERATRYLLKI